MILVREVVVNDLEQLTKLFNNYRAFYGKPEEKDKATCFLEGRIRNKDSKIYVAENSELQLAGFVQLYPLFSSTRMKKYWLLNDLFVDENFRGQKIAVSLIEEAKKLVVETDACGMYLETGKDNIIGNNLYPKTGFVKYDEVNFYEWENK